MSRVQAVGVFDALVDAGFIATLSGGVHGDHGEHYTVAVRALTLHHHRLLELLRVAEAVGCEVSVMGSEVRLIRPAA